MDQDISPIPDARQLVRSTRETIERKSTELKSETRYVITSLGREERNAAQLAQASRSHWSVENKNHWKPNPRALPWAAVECPFGALEHGISSANGATHDSLGQPP